MTIPFVSGARWAALRQHPSALLLAAQLLSLLLYPLMDDTQSGRVLFGAVALVVVPLAVWVVWRSAAANWIAWLLAVPAMGLAAGAIVFDRHFPSSPCGRNDGILANMTGPRQAEVIHLRLLEAPDHVTPRRSAT